MKYAVLRNIIGISYNAEPHNSREMIDIKELSSASPSIRLTVTWSPQNDERNASLGSLYDPDSPGNE